VDVTGENRIEIERVAQLLGSLRPAPPSWVDAAKELPIARPALDGLVARALADGEYRSAVLADCERALRDVGVAPTRELADALRGRLRGTPA
jgi:hypothetical protein